MAKLTSGKTLAVLMCFDVPVGIPDGQEEATLMPGISASVAVVGHLRVTTAKVLKIDPETAAKQFLDAVK